MMILLVCFLVLLIWLRFQSFLGMVFDAKWFLNVQCFGVDAIVGFGEGE